MSFNNLGSDVNIRRLGIGSRSDVCNLLFVSVARDLAFNLSNNLSEYYCKTLG